MATSLAESRHQKRSRSSRCVLIWRALGAAVVAVGLAAIALPCDCVSVRGKPWEAFREAKYVYLGQVARVSADYVYTLKVARAWKGSKAEYTLTTIGGCGFFLQEGRHYLMYAEDDPQEISICGSYPLDFCTARRDIAWLDRERGFPPTVVPGVTCTPLDAGDDDDGPPVKPSPTPQQ